MTDSIFNELRTIRSRLESIEKTQEVLVRAERDRILEEVLPAFANDLLLARTFLAVDGVRGQRQIAVAITESGHRVSEASVSAKLGILRDMDLIELVDRTVVGNIYAKTSIDRLLRLTRQVERILAEPA